MLQVTRSISQDFFCGDGLVLQFRLHIGLGLLRENIEGCIVGFEQRTGRLIERRTKACQVGGGVELFLAYPFRS